jgi:rod shape-determining protein MreC
MPGRQAVPDSPVSSADGLVGRVILAEGSYAKVQLVTDRASGNGAMIERTRRQGIVRGAGRDGLTLEYVPLHVDVQVGDRVLSSGTDGLYPRGVPIGTVLSVTPGGELFHSIRLAPAADFGQLDQVFVLLADSLPGRLKGSTSASP